MYIYMYILPCPSKTPPTPPPNTYKSVPSTAMLWPPLALGGVPTGAIFVHGRSMTTPFASTVASASYFHTSIRSTKLSGDKA